MIGTHVRPATNGKFAPFQHLWNAFIKNCRKNSMAGEYVTMDEQLIPFRGCCRFRQYIPRKPDKYSMKLFLMCDVATAYTFNGLPNVGRKDNQRCVGLAESVVKKLVDPVHNSGINVTTDNCFTNAKLAADLLHKQITLLGTVRKNKVVPPEFHAAKERTTGSSLFGFCQKQAMMFYFPKKGKMITLLSSMHDKKEVDERSRKLVMILNYNKTKANMDLVGQMCHIYSVQRRTTCWPLAYFYNCLNLAAIKLFLSPSFQIGKHILTDVALSFENIGMQLLRPHLENRKQVSQIPETMQNALKICGFAGEKPTEEDEERPRKHQRCHICLFTLDCKTVDLSAQCGAPCCNDHKIVICDC